MPNTPEMTIDNLPHDWLMEELGTHLALIRNGISKSQNKNKIGLPVTRIETISNDRIDPTKVGFISGLSANEIDKYRLIKFDLLLSHINSEPQIGRSVLYENNPPLLLHGMNLLLLRAKSSLNPEYLKYLFDFYRFKGIFIKISARAVNQNSINQGKMKQLLIPLPPLPEQRGIAHMLRTMQEARERTEAVIAATKALKKAMMKHLFTYGPVPPEEAEKVLLRETEIGMVPEEWEVKSIQDIAILRTETIRPENASNYKFVGLEHIEPGNIFLRQYGNGSSILSAKTLFFKGDILYGKLRPYLDKASLAPFDGICSTDILVIANKEGFNAAFLNYLMHMSSFRDYAISTMTGVNHPRTSWKSIREFRFACPNSKLQNEIVTILMTLENKIAAEESRRQALDTLFKTLLHDLMTAKVRVKDITVQ